ncbi:twin-arginine translocase TatA/TatE family subunit [Pseudonocardia sp. CA-142604]|uniref:twin-arginine translocase TatA/TatE family subunit n=1 Tax=Pseudonocardia sp. CA-142604 TaxID=3240024 RepID=UPI003D8E00C1
MLIFGTKKLPDMARSVGQSARVFAGEMKGMVEPTDPVTAPASPAGVAPGARAHCRAR